jgi:uncharacterized protein (TIGR03435 family)
MEGIAGMLRPYSGRPVVDRTGLTGYFRIDMTFDADGTLGRGNPAMPSNGPSLFTALPEQEERRNGDQEWSLFSVAPFLL